MHRLGFAPLVIMNLFWVNGFRMALHVFIFMSYRKRKDMRKKERMKYIKLTSILFTVGLVRQ